MDFRVNSALTLTYEHLEHQKKFSGASPPGPPRRGKGKGKGRKEKGGNSLIGKEGDRA